MKGRGGIAPSIFNASNGWRRFVSFIPRPLYAREKSTGTHRAGDEGEPEFVWTILRREKYLDHTGMSFRFLRHSHCSLVTIQTDLYLPVIIFKEETSKVLNLEHRFIWLWNLNTSESRSEISDNILKCGAGKGWRIPGGAIVCKMKYYIGSRRKGTSYVQ